MKPVFVSILFCALFGSILCKVKGLEILDLGMTGYSNGKVSGAQAVICYDQENSVLPIKSKWSMRYTRSFGFWPFARQVKLGKPVDIESFDSDKACFMAPAELPNGVTPNQGYKFQVVIKSSSWLPFTNQHSKWFKASDFKSVDSVAADVAELLEDMTGYCADCLDSTASGCKTKMIGACKRVQNLFNQAKERCDACVATIKTGIDGARERCANACKSLHSIFAKSRNQVPQEEDADMKHIETDPEIFELINKMYVNSADSRLLKDQTPPRDLTLEKRTKFLEDVGIEGDKIEDILALSQKIVSQYSIAELKSNIDSVYKMFQAVGVKPRQMSGVKALLAYDSQQKLQDAPKRLTYPGHDA